MLGIRVTDCDNMFGPLQRGKKLIIWYELVSGVRFRSAPLNIAGLEEERVWRAGVAKRLRLSCKTGIWEFRL